MPFILKNTKKKLDLVDLKKVLKMLSPKLIFTFQLFFLLSVLLVSCNETETAKTPTSISEAIEQDIPDTNEIPLSENVKKIVKNDTGVFRGVDFYTAMSEVKKLEDTTQIVEIDEEEDYINYTLSLNPAESVDILYYFNNEQEVIKIEANVYPENLNSQKTLFDDFSNYFSNKYGEPVNKKDDQIIWKQGKTIVVMTKTGNEKVHDLKIEFQPAGTDAVSTL